MPSGDSRSHDMVITPLYVLKKLEEHTEECSKRWWSVMRAVIVNLLALIAGMGGIILTILLRGHP